MLIIFQGPRFPPVGHAYDRQYSSQMKQVANQHHIELREGIYCGLGNERYYYFPRTTLNEFFSFFRWTLL
jgi:hypothetical protein